MASELGVQTIQHTNGTDALTVGSDGVVTAAQYIKQSSIPAFYIYNLTTDQDGAADFLRGGTSLTDTASGYNSTTGEYTVPVDGIYLFYAMIQLYNSGGTGYVPLWFQKNGTRIGAEGVVGYGGTHNNHNQTINQVILDLSANDAIKIEIPSSARNEQNAFMGHLIG